VRVLRIPNVVGAKNVPIGPSPVKVLLDFVLLGKALALGLRNRYALVHGVEDAGVMAWLAGRLTGAKVIYEKHSDPASYKRGALRNLVMAAYAKVEHFCIRHADAVIGTGPGLVEQARAVKAGVNAHHIPDIPSSLAEPDPAVTQAVRTKLLHAPDELLVTYVGSFAVYQGIDLMFESILQVVGEHPRTRFVIIGGSNAEIAERKGWLKDRGADANVTFAGKVPPDDLPNYLAASDVLLSPRVAGNNTPLKLLDYLKVGRAIVATDNEANRLILDETTSVLAAPDPASFARGIGALLTDKAQRDALASKGRALIESVHNFGVFKQRLDACYSSVGDR
jgi:glycosyltransferase involved in cell wall biosynthesis